MRYQSVIACLGPVLFPEFKEEKHYMIPFTKRDGLPESLLHWQPTVDHILKDVDIVGPMYIMIDSAVVKQGTFHRRPGVHIDGYWNPGVFAHGNPGHGHSPTRNPFHGPGHIGWEAADFSYPEALVLASNVSASRAFVGEYEGPIKDGGAAEHISTDHMRVVPLEAGKAYAGNVTMLHESLRMPVNAQRQLVRINIPGMRIN